MTPSTLEPEIDESPTIRYRPVRIAPPQQDAAQLAAPKPFRIQCFKCGENLPEHARFCGCCGQSLVPCFRCGETQPPRSRFCGRCGQPLVSHAATSLSGISGIIRPLPLVTPLPITPESISVESAASAPASEGKSSLLSKIPFLAALGSRPFALLWSGQTISALGDGAFTTAVAWQVLLLTGSATAMGLMMLAQTLPMILFLLLGGVVADRFPRKQVMLISDASRAVAVLIIAALSLTHTLQLWHLVVLALFFGVVRGLFMPASQAVIPHLVKKEQLASANSLSELSYQLNSLLGPLIGAGCVALAGATAAFGFDGLTFTISVACLLLLRLPAAAQPQASASAVGPLAEVRDTAAQLRDGLRYVAKSPVLWLTMALAAFSSISGAGALQVALPKLVHDVYGQSVWLLGIIWAAGGVGTLLAIVLTPSANRLRRRGFVLYLSMASTGLAFIAFALPLPHGLEPVVACVAMIVITCGTTIHEVMWVTVLQESVPDDTLGRVSSINQLAGFGFWPLGFVLTGTIADQVGPSAVFLGAGIVIALSYGLSLGSRSIRQIRNS
jgi:MFS family permease